jgi:hypothetical protein
MVALLALSSTMAMRVPATPVMVQRSTASPAPPRVSGPQAADNDRESRVPGEEDEQDFVADVGNEEGTAVAAGEGDSDAGPDGGVLIGDPVCVVEPDLDAVAIVGVLDALNRSEECGGAEHFDRIFAKKKAHAAAPR